MTKNGERTQREEARRFGEEVKRGWRVHQFTAMDRGGVETHGRVVGVKRYSHKCPYCKAELSWGYEVEVMWDPCDSRGKPYMCSVTVGPSDVQRRRNRNGWVMSQLDSITVFEEEK